MTSKRQVTVPKALADRYGIEPGAQLRWEAAGDVIRVIPAGREPQAMSIATRLELFAASVERQRVRQAARQPTGEETSRGWTREELYDRGRAR